MSYFFDEINEIDVVESVEDVNRIVFCSHVDKVESLELRLLKQDNDILVGIKKATLGYLYLCLGKYQEGLSLIETTRSEPNLNYISREYTLYVNEVAEFLECKKLIEDMISRKDFRQIFPKNLQTHFNAPLFIFKISEIIIGALLSWFESLENITAIDLHYIHGLSTSLIDYSSRAFMFVPRLSVKILPILKASFDILGIQFIYNTIPPTDPFFNMKEVEEIEMLIENHKDLFDKQPTNFIFPSTVEIKRLNMFRSKKNWIKERITIDYVDDFVVNSSFDYSFIDGVFRYKEEKIFELPDFLINSFFFNEIRDGLALCSTIFITHGSDYLLFYKGNIVLSTTFMTLDEDYMKYLNSKCLAIYNKMDKLLRIIAVQITTSSHGGEGIIELDKYTCKRIFVHEEGEIPQDITILKGGFIRIDGKIKFWNDFHLHFKPSPYFQGFDCQKKIFLENPHYLNHNCILIKNIAETMDELEKGELLEDFSHCLKTVIEKNTVSFEKQREREFPFCSFSKSYQRFLIFLMHLNDHPEAEFSKIPKDVLFYKIFPHLIEFDIITSLDKEIFSMIRVKFIGLTNVSFIPEITSEEVKRVLYEFEPEEEKQEEIVELLILITSLKKLFGTGTKNSRNHVIKTLGFFKKGSSKEKQNTTEIIRYDSIGEKNASVFLNLLKKCSSYDGKEGIEKKIHILLCQEIINFLYVILKFSVRKKFEEFSKDFCNVLEIIFERYSKEKNLMNSLFAFLSKYGLSWKDEEEKEKEDHLLADSVIDILINFTNRLFHPSYVNLGNDDFDKKVEISIDVIKCYILKVYLNERMAKKSSSEIN